MWYIHAKEGDLGLTIFATEFVHPRDLQPFNIRLAHFLPEQDAMQLPFGELDSWDRFLTAIEGLALTLGGTLHQVFETHIRALGCRLRASRTGRNYHPGFLEAIVLAGMSEITDPQAARGYRALHRPPAH